MNILFVCAGNIGRSQMAEALLRSKRKEYDIQSAGTLVDYEKEGKALKDTSSAGEVIAAMRELGIDVSQQSRTRVTPELVDWADKVFLLTHPDTAPAYLLESPKLTIWEIEDPYMMTIDETKQIRDLIHEKVDAIEL